MKIHIKIFFYLCSTKFERFLVKISSRYAKIRHHRSLAIEEQHMTDEFLSERFVAVAIQPPLPFWLFPPSPFCLPSIYLVSRHLVENTLSIQHHYTSIYLSTLSTTSLLQPQQHPPLPLLSNTTS